MYLKLCYTEFFPGSQYEPRHTRSVYYDSDSSLYVARAIIDGETILEVEADASHLAGFELSSRLVEHFRAERSAA